MKNNYILFFFLFFSALLNAQSIEPENHWWVTNGSVFSMVKQGNTLYFGGNFTQVMANTPNGTAINSATGQPDINFARPNGPVYATVPDGSGGWYIGGSFTTVGGQTRNRLARINSDGTLHPWNPNVNNTIQSIAVNGNTVYIGGDFTTAGGQTRNRLAAIDVTTGLVTGWNPNANDYVWSIAVNGSNIYVGGEFTTIGGQLRNYIAEIDSTTGLATLWNPNANNYVQTIALSGSTLYAGGGFSSIGGQTRNSIAAINTATGLATSWNPNATYGVNSPRIYTIAVSGSSIYAGGMFTGIGGQSRNNIASINATTGLATSWNPNANTFVQTISVNNGVVYAGGGFSTIGGQTRNNLAAIDATTGISTSWNPYPNANVSTIAVSGNVVYAGGTFEGTGTQLRNNIAALDATTGMPTAWDPNVNSTVASMAINGNTVYIAGPFFSTVGGQARGKLAAIDATTGIPTAWNPGANGTSVGSFAFEGNLVYVTGGFSIIGGQTRNYMAALDATTGIPTAFSINSDEHIKSFIISGNVIYVAGNFHTIGGQTRNHLAAIDITTGTPTAWNPNANDVVQDIALSGNTIYAAGLFTSIGGQPRNYIAAIDATTGIPTAWNPVANNYTTHLALSNNTVYVGGYFNSIGGQTRKRIAAIDATTGIPTAWNPDMNDLVSSIVPDNGKIYVGGVFFTVNGNPRGRIAVFANTCTLTLTGTQTNVLCKSQATGQATITATGGTGAYTYSWNTVPVQTTATASGLAAGTYTVTITDTNSCTATKSFTITEPATAMAFTPNTTQTNVLCNGQATGSATVAVNGGTAPYSYLWSNGQTANTITGLAAGTYTVDVTDANGCVLPNSFTITQPPALVATAGSQTNVLCHGNATGSATVNVTGGTGAYTYTWNTIPVQTSATATGLALGTYTVTVTDAGLCSTTQSFTITEPQPLAITPNTTQTNVSCSGGSNGSATIAVSGGTTPYSYLWSNGQTTSAATGLTAGTYTVDVTDANGCILSNSFIITEPSSPLVVTVGSQTDVLCHGTATGEATVNATGGTGPYSYSWNTIPVQIMPTATGLAAGTYTVTVTDANLCAVTQTFTVTEPLQPLTLSPNTTQTDIICSGQATGSATIAINGGAPPYFYLWSNGQTTATATELAAGTYSVMITDANGCQLNANITIIEPSEPLFLSTSQVNVDCASDTDGSITINATGGEGPYTYIWTPAVSTTNFATNLGVGNYNVVVTDANGCSDIRYLTIIASNAITGEFTVTDADCYTTGSSIVNVTGGVPPYTYLWSNGNTTAELQNVEPGTYTVVITGANGCSSTLSTTINGTNPIIITSQPQHITINGGETAIFTVQAQNVTSYQWQVSTNGGVTFTNLNGGGALPGYYGVATPTLTVANAYQFIDGYQYRVILLQQNGCYILSDAAVLNVNPVVAGTDDIMRVDVNIYPNPASIEVFVEIPDFRLHKNVTLTIHDLNGRLIKKENNIKSEKYGMDILGLESGIYIITITSDNARTDKKLIVDKRL